MPDGVAEVGDLVELRCGQVHEHDVRFGGEANLGAGLAPIAGDDVADVRAMRAGIGRIGAGGVVVERGERVEILERRVDRRTRQQTPIVVRRRSQRIARRRADPTAPEDGSCRPRCESSRA